MMGQYSCDVYNGDDVLGLGVLGCWYCTSVSMWLVVSLASQLVFVGILDKRVISKKSQFGEVVFVWG
jgi:hypothetical protein